MKTKLLIFGLLMIFSVKIYSQKDGFAELIGPYLGQKLPGTIPEIFAPGIVSTGLDEAGIAFMPNGKECYWTIIFSRFETIVTSRLENERWTEPEVASFAGRYYDGWPAIQPDGKRIFFHSSRPVNKCDSGITSKYNIWYADRVGDGWSEPKIVGTPVNGNETATCPSVTYNGTLYFSRRFNDKSEKICRSKFIDGKYSDLEILPACINKVKDNYHAFVAPDESYIIMPAYGREDAIGGGWNYYISFNEGDNIWSELINLGKEVNSAQCWGTPSISCDGKYLFIQVINPGTETLELDRKYTLKELIDRQIHYPAANCTDLMWLDTKIIEELKPKK